MKIKRGCRTAIENGVIITLLVLSVCIFVLSFFPYSRISAFFLQELEMKRITERICSLVFMFTFWHLMQRQRAAWAVSVLLLAIGIAQHIIFLTAVIRTAFARNPLPLSSALSLVFILAEALILLFLLLYSRDFCCRSAHETPAAESCFLSGGHSCHPAEFRRQLSPAENQPAAASRLSVSPQHE
jgi:hypothetical protein